MTVFTYILLHSHNPQNAEFGIVTSKQEGKVCGDLYVNV